jgi:hypothetical protein
MTVTPSADDRTSAIGDNETWMATTRNSGTAGLRDFDWNNKRTHCVNKTTGLQKKAPQSTML